MAELNLPQPELLASSSEELEVMPERIDEVNEASDFGEGVLAEVVPITEAPSYEAPEAHEETSLETTPVPVTAAGEPVDMAYYRRLQMARQEVIDAYAAATEPPHE